MNRAPLKRKKGLNRRALRRYRTGYERAPGDPIKGQACAYCGQPAVNGDHVIPRALVKRYNHTAPDDAPSIPVAWLRVEPSCFACNTRKGQRRLLPASWEPLIPAMSAFFGGAPWRVWDGDPMHEAFREVHK